MEKIAKKLTDLVGNTPLLELSNYNKNNDLKARLIVKIESFNPAGSVKDRIALAFVSAAKGYKLILTMPNTGERYLVTILYAFEEHPLL